VLKLGVAILWGVEALMEAGIAVILAAIPWGVKAGLEIRRRYAEQFCGVVKAGGQLSHPTKVTSSWQSIRQACQIVKF
jgi:hypothetical protein